MNKVSLSICIPTYNRAVELKKLLDSILEAEPQIDLQVIVTDNASSDNTTELISNYKPKLNLDYLRHTENIGFDANLISAISLASHEYIWLIGSDDVIPSNAFSCLIELLDNYDAGIYVCGRINLSQDLSKIKTSEYFYPNSILGKLLDTSKNEHISLLFRELYPMGGAFSYMSSLIIKTILVKQHLNDLNLYKKFPGYVHMELCLRIVRNGVLFFAIEEFLILNRTNNDTHTNPLERRLIDYNACSLANNLFTGVLRAQLLSSFSRYLLKPSYALGDIARAFRSNKSEGAETLNKARNDAFKHVFRLSLISHAYAAIPPRLLHFRYKLKTKPS
jgi:abequosyltransferase